MSTRTPATTEADSEAPRWAPAQLDASNKPARRWRLDLAADDDEARHLLRALGCACLEEHAEWILLHRERPLEGGPLSA